MKKRVKLELNPPTLEARFEVTILDLVEEFRRERFNGAVKFTRTMAITRTKY